MSYVATDRREAERIFVTPVTVNYFTTLGVVPAAGRLFDQRDSDEPGASPLAVVSHQFWTTHFSADPAVVGRTLSINGGIFTIVGVTPKGFHGTGIRSGDAWIPLGMGNAVSANRAGAWLLLGGRLKSGVPLSQASAELETLGASLQQEFPDENRGRGLRAAPLSPVPGNSNVVGAFVLLLGGIVVVVLAIACANVVGVLMARAEARRAEIAVRLAIGAGRRRLIRQLLTETFVLFALGGAIGLALARIATSVVVSRLPRLPFPIELSLAMDYRAVMFTALLVLVAALGSGLVPAWQSSRTGVAFGLRDDGRTPRRQRLRHLFVTAQIAFSILLVAVGGLFVRSLQLAGSSDPGFEPHGLELATLDLSQAGYTPATGSLLAQSLLESVRRLPSVESASMAVVLPGGFETWETAVQVPGAVPRDGQTLFGVDLNAIESGYFSTLRIPFVSGRDFTSDDRAGAEDVAIVGEGLSRQFWPGQDPVGKHMLLPAMGPHGPTSPVRSLRVVGVVRDVRASSLIDGLAQSLLYLPLQQHYGSGITIVVRGRSGRTSEDLRAALARIKGNLPVTTQTLEEYSEVGLMPQRIALWLAGGLGLVGLLLAAIGIYGVTSYMVTSRTREFGVRLALGAQRLNLLRLVLRHGLAITVVGSLIGLALAGAAGQVLTAFLFGASPIDMPMFVAAAAMYVSVGLAACLVPALRASFVNPLEALRRE
jgi:predicted permease